MNVIIFGAAGDVGSRIVQEAVERGHQVTAVVRSTVPERLSDSNARIVSLDVMQVERLADYLIGFDLAISALRPSDGHEADLTPLTEKVLDAVDQAGVRALVLGGAASLRVPGRHGHTVLTAPGFLPDAVRPIAEACQAQLDACMARDATDWTYLAPPAELLPGARTGDYRIGCDTLVLDSAGRSHISMEDLAVAMLDEAEAPKHRNMRFTVAY